MRLRHGYLLAGVAWALFLAPAVTFAVLGAGLGALWIYVFGDNPWPPATDWVIPLIGLVVFLSVAACCIVFAYGYGRRRETEAGEDPRREWRKVLLWTLAPLALIAVTAMSLWQRSIHQARETAALEQRQAAFTDLLNARHTLAGLLADRSGDGSLVARVAISGGRPGPYRLLWQINSGIYGEVLSGDLRNIGLGAEGNDLDLEIGIREVAESYRDKVIKGGGVLVDEAFELVVMLEPELTDRDMAAWPVYELHLWERQESSLRSRMATEFPVRFLVRQDGTIDYSP